MESDGDQEQTREVYERAIACVPPSKVGAHDSTLLTNGIDLLLIWEQESENDIYFRFQLVPFSEFRAYRVFVEVVGPHL